MNVMQLYMALCQSNQGGNALYPSFSIDSASGSALSKKSFVDFWGVHPIALERFATHRELEPRNTD